ncbi:hypothetical protein [Bradyrhizobium guangzhouense]|uniref:hypothetical protein n=1 Tax=Bradyrhizobium guangzhouense TaxID=1325095 RepID=UPI001FDEFD7A|nr:hypothetical protein [Bradyrhizobium guangzhouense]
MTSAIGSDRMHQVRSSRVSLASGRQIGQVQASPKQESATMIPSCGHMPWINSESKPSRMLVAGAPTVMPRTMNWAFVRRQASMSFAGAMARIENPVPSCIRKSRNVRTSVVVHIAASLS